MAFANLSYEDKLKYYDKVNASLSKTESIIKKANERFNNELSNT